MTRDDSNPNFTGKFDKTEFLVQIFWHAPCCARGKMLVLCVGEMKHREEVIFQDVSGEEIS